MSPLPLLQLLETTTLWKNKKRKLVDELMRRTNVYPFALTWNAVMVSIDLQSAYL